MAEGKKSFLLYCDLIHTVRKMPKEKAGELLLHILEYVNDNNPEIEDLLLQLVFEPIKQQLKRDLNKWELEINKKSNSGKLGNLKRWNLDLYELVIKMQMSIDEAEIIALNRKESQSIALRQNESHSIANIAVSENDTVSDSDTVKGKDKRKNKGVFTPPSFIDFEIYCKENGFKNIAERAFKGYSENDWKDSKGNKVLNWKSKLQNVWFDEKNKDKQNSEKLIRCIRKDHMGRCEVEITMAKIEQLRKNGTHVEIL